MVIIEGPLSWSEAIRHYVGRLMDNVQSSLYEVEKLRNSIALQAFDNLH